MDIIYTHTTWKVRPGMESEFEKRWADWAQWGHKSGLVKGARLTRSTDEPDLFVSFGLWQNLAQAKAWRSAAGYQERIERLQEVVVSFEPRTLKLVSEK